jgi:hypothetical protein
MLLSEDGATFTPALSGELSLLPSDQAFMLPAPVPARFAQLEIDSAYAMPPSTIALGEWKVIAAPGVVPAATPFNLADPALGGHVVWMDPQSGDLTFPDGLLSEDPARQTLSVEAGISPQWVIGFNDDRAAQITELQWVDPPDSTPDARFTRVMVEASLSSPLGPWQPLADWELTRAVDGSVAPLTLDTPIWARFLRFTGAGAAEATTIEEPATLRVIEVF